MKIAIEGNKNPLNLVKGNQTGYRKNTLYRLLMNKLGLSPENVLAIGDEITDKQEAEIAGINFLGCNWGGKQQVNDISDPSEIISYILAKNKGEI
jgi:phosphoglycolate phosphatase-like HAD superfamily hydrolase